MQIDKGLSLPDFLYQFVLIFKSNGIRLVKMIRLLSNFDSSDLYRVAESGILTVQEAVQAKMIMIYWVSQKIYPILKLNFEVVMNILMGKMLVSPDSKNIYKSFGT